MSKKPYKVLMLPVNCENPALYEQKEKLNYPDQTITSILRTAEENKKQFPHSIFSIRHKRHLYIVSDDIIKQGDWYLNELGFAFCCGEETNGYEIDSIDCKKIIATTDKLLTENNLLNIGISSDGFKQQMNFKTPLPQIPESFVMDYVKEGGIDEVYLEWDYIGTDFDENGRCVSAIQKPKLINNTVIIKVI